MPRQGRAENPRQQTDEHAFENKKSQHTSARRAQRQAERNLAAPSAEAHEQQVRHVAASDEQNKPDRR
ncbi:MAG: hypothetical protein DME78_12175 [Verrucomicrobia bacterium]|nr:MAG: hypothetical protein DME78_12175 [Verrucomicrobiota bacterium]